MNNSQNLMAAYTQGQMVRFVYQTQDGRYVPRMGTVRGFNTPTHVIINDIFWGGKPRTVTISRIVGDVDIQGG